MKIATHNAKFHTDDVFAVATLLILYPEAEVVRTRDKELIKAADIVVDVGQVYDPENNRFDHHQIGGAGERENAIPYASFGLVWEKFGEKVSGSKSVRDAISKSLVEPIDAIDNGKEIYTPLIQDVFPFGIGSLVDQYRLTWKEEGDWDQRFLECVEWAKTILKRQIKITQDIEDGKKIIVNAYERSADKRIIIMEKDEDTGREAVQSVLSRFPEPIYAVLYRSDSGNWQVAAIRTGIGFGLRKALPGSWGAKIDQELEEVTGVVGAVFCHRNGFMCVAQSKEGAIKLAEIALNA